MSEEKKMLKVINMDKNLYDYEIEHISRLRKLAPEIVQCYFHAPVAGRVRPVKKLAAFERVYLRSGETKEVVFKIPIEKLGYYDQQMNYIMEDGIYEFFVGGNSEDCLKADLNKMDIGEKNEQ